MGQWNLNGWNGKSHDLKSKILLSVDCDVIGLCETFLVDNETISLNGYHWIGNNRKNLHKRAHRGSGGVGFLIKSHILNTFTVKILDNSFDDTLWIKLINKNDDSIEIILCVSYLPPPNSSRGNNSQEFYERMLTNTYTYCDNLSPVIILGDFNARIGKLQDVSLDIDNVPDRKSIDYITKNHEPFLDFLNDGRLCVLNGRFKANGDNFTSISTKGSAVVDYIIVPYDNLGYVTNFNVNTISDILQQFDIQPSEMTKLPDHSILVCDYRLTEYFEPPNNDIQDVNKMLQSDSDPILQNRKYRRENITYNMFENDRTKKVLVNIIEQLENKCKSVDELNLLYTNFVSELHSVMDDCLKYKDSCRKKMRNIIYKPWWNNDLKQLWSKAHKAEKQYLRFKNSANKKTLYTNFVEQRKAYDKCYRKNKRKYQANKRNEIKDLQTDNPRKFWEEIKKLGPRSVTKIPQELFLPDGSLTTDINVILHTWEQDYKKLFTNNDSDNDDNKFDDQFLEQAKTILKTWEDHYRFLLNNMDNNFNPGNNMNDILNSQITLEEVKKVISELKNHKATGIDNLPNEVLKCNGLAEIICKLFNVCLNIGIVPSMWTQTILNPIAKKGKDSRIPLNTRAISLISTVCKLFSSVLNKRLVTFIDDNNLLCEEQNGFRRLRACIDHLYVLCTVIRKRKKANKPTYVAFIDFSKAFDSVNHDLLWFKLTQCGIDGKFLRVLQFMYKNISLCVKLHGKFTNWFPSDIGVRQGDVLSPTLFSLFVNDLANEIKQLQCGVKLDDMDISILLYADDIVLIAENEKSLQRMLDKLNSWCSSSRLDVNCAKSQVIHFRKENEAETNFEFKIGTSIIQVVNSYKYLGLELNYSLNLTNTVNILATAASRSLGSLTYKYYNLNGIDIKTFQHIYDATVVKVMDYCAGVWGGPLYNKCDVVQNRAMRTILGLPRVAPIKFMYGELDWISPQIRQKLETIRLWYRIASMPASRLTKSVFMKDNSHWMSSVKLLFQKTNLGYIFANKDVQSMSLRDILDKCTTYLLEEYRIKWYNEISTTSRLSLYSQFKFNPHVEPYIYKLHNRNQRSVIAKLRSSTLNKLAVEFGRYRNIAHNERYCQRCNKQVVDDEEHFLLFCDKFNEDRAILLEKALQFVDGFIVLSLDFKVYCLLTDPKIVLYTSQFVLKTLFNV